MATSAEGIVENAATFTGMVRKCDFIHLVLNNDADEPISNMKFKVTFQNGQTIRVESDGEGVLKFPRKAQGEFEIELLEEEEANTESSDGET